jgi:hypothetical protein
VNLEDIRDAILEARWEGWGRAVAAVVYRQGRLAVRRRESAPHVAVLACALARRYVICDS